MYDYSGLENREYGRGDPLRWPRDTLYQLKLALTSPTGCGRSVGIVRLRTKTTECVCVYVLLLTELTNIDEMINVKLRRKHVTLHFMNHTAYIYPSAL
jgi:hypothetical protein